MEDHLEYIRAVRRNGVTEIWKFIGTAENGLPVGEVSRTVMGTQIKHKCYFCGRLGHFTKAGGIYYCSRCV